MLPYNHTSAATWWNMDGPIHEHVIGCFSRIYASHKSRLEAIESHVEMYWGNTPDAITNGRETRGTGRISENAIRSAIDAAVAHLATNRPKPQFLTIDGNDEYQKKSKGLTDFVGGQYHGQDIYRKCLIVFLEAAIKGTGILKIYPDYDKGEVCVDRDQIDDFFVDFQDAKMGSPRTKYHHKEVDREVLINDYPDKEGIIRKATRILDQERGDGDTLADKIGVVESWHLPSGRDSGDGRHVIVISTGELENEEWDCEEYPTAKFDYATPLNGYYGSGVCSQSSTKQNELDYLSQKAQDIMTLSTPMAWVEAGSKVNISQMSNKRFAVRTYSGKPPIFTPMVQVGAEFFNRMQSVKNSIFEDIGMNQLHVQAQKPAGLNSGKALREFNDTASKRHLHLTQRWEDFHMDIARRLIDAARELDEHLEGGYSVVTKGKNSIREIKFSEVNLERDKYVIQVFPTNFLSSTPAAKIEDIKEMMQIDPTIAEGLLGYMDNPDLEALTSYKNAPFELADLITNTLLLDGKAVSPSPYHPTDLLKRRLPLAIMRAEINGTPEKKIDLARVYLERLHKMEQAAAPQPDPNAQPPQQPPVPAGPPLPA